MAKRMSSRIVVKRTVKVNMGRALKDMTDDIQIEAINLGVERAKIYVPVDTGWLRAHIVRFSKSTYGSKVRYAGYVEDGTRFMYARKYLERSFKDVMRALPGIEHDAFVRGFTSG